MSLASDALPVIKVTVEAFIVPEVLLSKVFRTLAAIVSSEIVMASSSVRVILFAE